MKKILFMFVMIFIMPICVFASGEIEVSKTSLTIDNGSSQK